MSLVRWRGRVALAGAGGVTLVGDSLAVGLSAQLAAELGPTFSALHQSGTTIAYWLAAPSLAAALAEKPTTVLVSLGTNDLAGKVSADVLRTRVKELVARIQTAGATPVWLSPGPLPWSTAPLSAALSEAGIKTIVQPPIQKPDGIHPTGAGYKTWSQTIAAALAAHAPSVAATILAAPGLEKNTSNAFRWALIELAERRKLNPDYLATVISFETAGTFSPSKQNPFSSATGLLQFLPSWIKSRGFTVEQFASLSQIEQLKYVEKFMQGNAPGGLGSLCDHYLAVFSPYFIGHPESEVMAQKDSAAGYAGSKTTQAIVYKQNSGFDKDKKGYFTVGDVCALIKQRHAAAGGKRLVVTPEAPPTSAAGASLWPLALAVAGVAAAIWWRSR